MTVSLTQITAQAAGGMQLVGTDYTPGGMSNTTSETELLTVDIPAGTVTNGIIIISSFAIRQSSLTNNSYIRIKAGTDGSESTYETITYSKDESDRDYANVTYPTQDQYGMDNGVVNDHTTVVDDLDWTSAQTVSITAQFDDDDATNEAMGQSLTVTGY